MKLFSVPADFKKETIDYYEKINNRYDNARVIETYGNITIGSNFGSGRALKQLPEIDLLGLREYVAYSDKKNIPFSYTLNISYLENKEFTQEGAAKIIDFLKHLHEAGIRSLTLSMPSLIELVQNAFPDFKIKASAICHINTPNKALAYRNMGVDRIVVDESVHRDFDTLKRMVELFGDKVEIIVNTMCHRNCIYRHFHYNEAGGNSTGKCNETGVDFFEHKCLLQRYDGAEGLLKLGWVRPEDLKHYENIGIHYFKLQGRQHVAGGGHLKTLQHYVDESFDGSLMDLLDMFNQRYSFKVVMDNKKLDGYLTPFVNNSNFCKNDCSACSYCRNFAGKCVDIPKSEDVIAMAKKFYSESDGFKETIHKAKSKKKTPPPPKNTPIDFDLD